MNSERLLLDKWRNLPLEQRQQVFDFIEGLDRQKLEVDKPSEEAYQPQTELGKKLWEIRRRSLAYGPKLLTWDEINEEVSDRRGERQ